MIEYQNLKIDVELEEGEYLGLFANNDLTVTYVQPHTQAYPHFLIGDIIKSVNGRPVENIDAFYFLVKKIGFPICTIGIQRRKSPASSTENSQQSTQKHSHSLKSKEIPKEWEKLIKHRPGYEYLCVHVDCQRDPNKRLGLSVINRFDNRVLVSTILDGSHSQAAGLKTLDVLLVINGTLVTDKEITRKVISNSGGVFSVALERPKGQVQIAENQGLLEAFLQNTKHGTAKHTASPTNQQPTNTKEDEAFEVKDIVNAQLEKFRQYRERRLQRQALRAQGISVMTEVPEGILHVNPVGTKIQAHKKVKTGRTKVTKISRETPEGAKLRHVPR